MSSYPSTSVLVTRGPCGTLSRPNGHPLATPTRSRHSRGRGRAWLLSVPPLSDSVRRRVSSLRTEPRPMTRPRLCGDPNRSALLRRHVLRDAVPTDHPITPRFSMLQIAQHRPGRAGTSGCRSLRLNRPFETAARNAPPGSRDLSVERVARRLSSLFKQVCNRFGSRHYLDRSGGRRIRPR